MALKSKDKIYFDTDCLSSFLCVNRLDILITLYGKRIIIPSMVQEEIRKIYPLFKKLSSYQNLGLFNVESFSCYSDAFKLYGLLVSGSNIYPRIGSGEASVIALAKCNEATMASNNLKDISYYIKFYNLNNITTADILFEALQKEIVDMEDCENIWAEMLNKKRFLPTKSFQSWIDKFKGK